LLGLEPKPLLYFQDPALNWTLRRLQSLIADGDGFDVLTGETLCLLAALQLYSVEGFAAAPGRLTLAQKGRIEDYIGSSIGQPITLSELASVSGMSRFHFARSFHRTYGQPPHQYLLRRRIARAATLLARSSLPIAEIAEITGFSAPARLSTAFRRIMGCSPRWFRNRTR